MSDYDPWRPTNDDPNQPPVEQPGGSDVEPAQDAWGKDRSAYTWASFSNDDAVEIKPKHKGGGGRPPFWQWLIVALVAALIGGTVGAYAAINADTSTSNSASTSKKTTTTESPSQSASQAASPQSIRSVLQKVQPAVVTIDVEDSSGSASGTGMIISSDGQILTNAHVVNGANSISVTLDGSKTPVSAHLLGLDTTIDSAVIKLDNGKGLPTVELGDSSTAQVGDQVVAIGYPLALAGGPSVTTGIVSATGRSLPEENGVILSGLVQTDAAINSGNSGGPLTNMQGQVIGMNTAVLRGQSGEYQNIGFSLAMNTIKPAIPDLVSGQTKQAGYLGVNPVTLTSDIKSQYNLTPDSGAVVDTVQNGSPADRAGLSRFDVITKFGGQDVDTAEDLVAMVRAHHAGDQVPLTYYRGANKKDVTVTLTSRPAS